MSYNRMALFERIIQNDQYNDFLDFATYMWITRRFSLFNSALIYLQRPGSQYVENEEIWSARYKRKIKPEATPIVVLKPFGPVDFLYDLADTYGKSMPDYMRSSFVQPPLRALEEYDFKSFTNAVNRMGISYSERPLGSRLGGWAEYLDYTIYLNIKEGKETKKVSTRYVILTNSNFSDSQKASVILHEIGHIMCGHLGNDKDNKLINVPDRDKDNLTENIKEFEAEKVCEIVSKMLCIESNSEEYLKNYTDNGNEPSYSLRIVIDAADKVIKYFDSEIKTYYSPTTSY